MFRVWALVHRVLRLRFLVPTATILLLAAWGGTGAARAQTAYFSGIVSTLTSSLMPSSCATAPSSSAAGPTGVAVDRNGNVFVAGPCANTIAEIVAVNGSIPANPTINTVGSGFNQPYSVAVDGRGNVYVTDYGNDAVKEIVAVNGSISASPQIITLATAANFAGPNTPEAAAGPAGIAVDGKGDVFVTNFINLINGVTNAIQEIVAVNGSVSASSQIIQLATNYNFSYPEGLAVDANGDVFVADYDRSTVEEIAAVNGSVSASSTVRVLASTTGHFNLPDSIAVDASGNLFVTDSGNNVVKEIVAVNGNIPEDSPVVNVLGSDFSQPNGIAMSGNGDVFVADTLNTAVKEIQTAGVNFGSVAVATTTPPTVLLPFAFDTTTTIGAPAVLTQGAPNLDFTNAGTGTCTANSTFAARDSCTVSVTFTPKSSGPRYGAVQLLNGAGTVIATGYVYGTGTGPQIAFPPGAITAQIREYDAQIEKLAE